MNYEVVGIGGLCLDIIAATPRIPETDMASELLYTISQGGGKVPTALVALGRLGVACTLFSTYGGDAAGSFCLQELQDSGVDIGNMVCLPEEKTNLTFCLAERDTGGRSFIGKYKMRDILPNELDREVIENARFLHLWNVTEATLLAAEWIHGSGGQVVFDADRYQKATEENLQMADVFICSEFFFTGMCGKDLSPNGLERGLRRIKGCGPGIVIVTLGARGYVGIDEQGYFEGTAFTDIPVLDTTGAGDVFHGAYIYGLLQGWDSRKTARYASAVSAIKCTALGGRTGIPDAKTTDEFLRNGRIDRTLINKWTAYYEKHRIL